MIYLIGVNHIVQHNGNGSNPDVNAEFSEFLKDNIIQLGITFCAEEFNEEALEMSNASESTLLRIARELQIEHRYCDPDSTERRKLGIPIRSDVEKDIKKRLNLPPDCCLGVEKLRESAHRQQVRDELQNYEVYCEDNKDYLFGLREEFWFNKIQDKIKENILFVCGYEHIYRFKNLLQRNGCNSEIIINNWNDN